MANLFALEVLTPYRPFFSDKVEAIVADLPDGQIGVRAGHSPFVSPVKTCVLRVLLKDGSWKEAAVGEGVLEVTAERAVMLVGSAEWPEDIDRERAEAAVGRAEDVLSQDLMKYEADRARAALCRAKTRLSVIERAAEAARTIRAKPESSVL